MLNVGLTGGIATGKSLVSGMFREKGACMIDFDALTRWAQEPDRLAWKGVVDHFGVEILNDDRTINRDKLGAIVFNDQEMLKKLNEIVHPVLFDRWRDLVSEIRGKNPEAIVISDIPLLIETKAQKLFDIIILVYAKPEQQIERMIDRNRCTREDALKRLASQIPIDEKIPYADMIIDNSVSVEETKKRVDEIWEELKLANL